MEAIFSKEESLIKREPNDGIKYTKRNILFLGTIWSVPMLIIISLTFYNSSYFIAILVLSIVVGILINGGFDLINYYSLRLTLHRFNTFPLKAVPFLDHCTKLILLRRVGGSYIFIHRLLLEHFAQKYHEKSGVKK
ncbi:hypothetical protein [Candidatus Albibeggiatoa sp. nov. BB20]|uniref:hypothetical protein n=1 Tax=Candidatus Albibeggiatoa sp. nov. BB20 TaxID=3162723 RepID=UPI00336547D5